MRKPPADAQPGTNAWRACSGIPPTSLFSFRVSAERNIDSLSHVQVLKFGLRCVLTAQ